MIFIYKWHPAEENKRYECGLHIISRSAQNVPRLGTTTSNVRHLMQAKKFNPKLGSDI